MQRVFLFLLRPVGRRDLSAGLEQKNHHPGCVFFAPAPAKGRGKISPLAKKHPGWCFVFVLAPPKGRGAQRGATKKKHFAHPGTTAKKILATHDTGHEQKGAKKKKTGSLRLRFRGDFSRWCFFFCCGPADAHSLTAVLGGDASRRGGVFFDAAPPGPGWCFFCWGDFGKALVSGFFFCCGPAEPGEPITKKVWCTTSGLKRPGGATAKKKHHFPPYTLNPTP